jgi:hypothetical protein
LYFVQLRLPDKKVVSDHIAVFRAPLQLVVIAKFERSHLCSILYLELIVAWEYLKDDRILSTANRTVLYYYG